ncbi:MAG: hypothetical protein H0W86_07280 [Armatimonadetes bacterium]|nr:hypothetical protein [Armatimonadota bacterium]
MNSIAIAPALAIALSAGPIQPTRRPALTEHANTIYCLNWEQRSLKTLYPNNKSQVLQIPAVPKLDPGLLMVKYRRTRKHEWIITFRGYIYVRSFLRPGPWKVLRDATGRYLKMESGVRVIATSDGVLIASTTSLWPYVFYVSDATLGVKTIKSIVAPRLGMSCALVVSAKNKLLEVGSKGRVKVWPSWPAECEQAVAKERSGKTLWNPSILGKSDDAVFVRGPTVLALFERRAVSSKLIRNRLSLAGYAITPKWLWYLFEERGGLWLGRWNGREHRASRLPFGGTVRIYRIRHGILLIEYLDPETTRLHVACDTGSLGVTPMGKVSGRFGISDGLAVAARRLYIGMHSGKIVTRNLPSDWPY